MSDTTWARALKFAIAHPDSEAAQKLDELFERMVATLHEPRMKYRGIWQRSDEYQRGDTVTHSGALWHCCTSDTTEKPGTGEGWQMMHKT